MRRHAIVIGGSIAGLAAAAALADAFERVTLIDRDRLPAGAVDRAGVPQGRHGHGLLASGREALERLFPGFGADLVAAGAVAGDVTGDVRWFQYGCYKAKFVSGLQGVLASRPLIESVVRARIARRRNVQIMQRCHVAGLIADETSARIVGVRTQPDVGDHVRNAELVVDASGHASRSPIWLAEIGYEPPGVERVPIHVSYVTRLFERRPCDLDGDAAVIIAATPPLDRRLGTMLAIERDRWMVTLGGVHGERVPIDEHGYLAYARTLAAPDIYRAIRHAIPVGDVATFQFAESCRSRYDRLARFPGNYLIVGDALCSFNPVYGQGMSVAALEADALSSCLAEQLDQDGLWRRLQPRLNAIVDAAWHIAVQSDLAFPEARASHRPRLTTAVNWYLARVHEAASVDDIVCRRFFDVANLLAPSSALARPGILGRIARHAVFGRHITDRQAEPAARWQR